MQGTMRATTPLAKPRLGLPAICNLSFGFFGIQIAFALQTANVSGIFQTLGASMDALPILWIAGPVTGLLVQPIIGYLSDRTWGRLGRRRPYFLAGAVAGALALATLANAPYLWLAVLALWVLDVSVNVSMEPFRAFVGDMLPTDQQTTGYAVQTILIGLGASVASAGPYLLTHFASVAGHAGPGVVADSTRLAFDVGVAHYDEPPPEAIDDLEALRLADRSVGGGVESPNSASVSLASSIASS